ncbi:MAG: AsmA family protein [Candidatus Omnitrophota bacterium]
MRILFNLVMILLFIAIVGGIVFLATLDLNKYKDVLIEKIEDGIDKDVKIYNISLNIFPELALKINGLLIKERSEDWGKPTLKISSVDAAMEIMPLLKKEIEIKKIHIRGLELNISKGLFTKRPLLQDSAKPKDMDTAILTGGALKFLAKSVVITDSSIKYMDDSLGLLNEIELGIIESKIENISLYGPSSIDARLSLFGDGKENIRLSTLVYPEIELKKPYLKNLELKVDISNLDIPSLLKLVQDKGLREQFIGKKIKGELALSSRKAYLMPEDLAKSTIDLELSDGMTDIAPIKDPIKDIELKAKLDNGILDIDYLKGRILGGNFLVNGKIDDIIYKKKSKLDIVLKDIGINSLIPDLGPGKPAFEGSLDSDIDVEFSGFDKDSIINSLSAGGTIALKDPVLKDMNALRVVLDQLDMLPGLAKKLESRLTMHYRELLEQDNTYFKTIDTGFTLKGSALFFKELNIESDAFYVKGRNITLDIYSYDFASSQYSYLFIPKDLSYTFISIVNELKYLSNNEGMITMPLNIYGRFPDISIVPDLDYVIQRLAVSKGQELLGDLIRKSLPSSSKEETRPPQDDSDIPDQESGEEDSAAQREVKPEEMLIRTIFDILGGARE